MNPFEVQALDAQIQRELERMPDLSGAIPADFAARVAAKVPAKRVSPATTATHYGSRLVWVSLVVLSILLIVLAGESFVHSTIGIAIEWTLCAQFLAIVIWLGTRRWRSS
ncbi:hypothetical protein [Edaphobacter albus]|uniref:hypothetical protein n=1 Tax=Edaphobacter sp. 4G125 TaxID=2763071 RepID=UPI001645FC9F|nr:hypothetical protein [Edaphobacter sp. 4G125]QNI38206.1 hypothetical protein H7846_08185 [Edaphobacter sp. 4G125]